MNFKEEQDTLMFEGMHLRGSRCIVICGFFSRGNWIEINCLKLKAAVLVKGNHRIEIFMVNDGKGIFMTGSVPTANFRTLFARVNLPPWFANPVAPEQETKGDQRRSIQLYSGGAEKFCQLPHIDINICIVQCILSLVEVSCGCESHPTSD